MESVQLTRLRIFSKGIEARLSTIYHQLQSGKREKRRNICMSSMISEMLLQFIGALHCYVHIPQTSVKAPKKKKSPRRFFYFARGILESHVPVCTKWSVAGLYNRGKC